MTANEAISAIRSLLGYSVKSENFYKTVLVDGATEVTTNSDKEMLEVGDELFIVDGSVLKPAPEGVHETREGLMITTGADSVVVKIEQKPEADETSVEDAVTGIEDEREDMMSTDTLADGTKIETDESGKFAVGQQLYFITEAGEKVKAPAGEHTTQSGITIVTDGDGIITGVKYPDESGEGSLEDMKKMKEAMAKMVDLMSEFSKFTNDFESFKKDFEAFKKQPDRAPVVQTFSKGTNEVLDWKLELIKGSRK
jgi:hypothetical protein